MKLLHMFAFLMAASSLALAGEATLLSDNPVLEERVMNVAGELRCLVCQNQTLADSHSPLAADLRKEMREQMAAGKSDKEVVDFMVVRYGDFVLYRPPFKATTLLLWLGPFLLLILGGLALYRYFRDLEPENDK